MTMITTTTTTMTMITYLQDFDANMGNLPDIDSQAFKAMDGKPTAL